MRWLARNFARLAGVQCGWLTPATALARVTIERASSSYAAHVDAPVTDFYPASCGTVRSMAAPATRRDSATPTDQATLNLRLDNRGSPAPASDR